MSELSACPLCVSPEIAHYHRDRPHPRRRQRDYWQCAECELVFVSPGQRLGPQEEKAVYDRHENSPQDIGYRRFLGRVFEPLNARLAPHSSGLDFGCGPGPALSVMFEEAGHRMALYDPFYAPGSAVLEATYDFITTTEVVEHLFTPGETLATLVARLRPGGWLGVMTKRLPGRQAFADWHYILDPTHVCFFSESTFRFLAQRHCLTVEFPAADVVLMQRL
ncbi:class I SAM-dependent methyltransferase [Halomonas sp. WWR20]